MTVSFYNYMGVANNPNKIAKSTLVKSVDISEIQLVKQDGLIALLGEFIAANYATYTVGSLKYVCTVEFLSTGNDTWQYTLTVDAVATAWENGVFDSWAVCERSNEGTAKYDPELTVFTQSPERTVQEWNKRIYPSNTLGYLYAVTVIDTTTLRGGSTTYIMTPSMYDDFLSGFADLSGQEQQQYSSCISVLLLPEDVIPSDGYASTTTPVKLYSKNQEWFAGWRDLPAYVEKVVGSVGGYVAKYNNLINDFNTDTPIISPNHGHQSDRYIFQMRDGSEMIVPVAELTDFSTLGVRCQSDLTTGIVKYTPLFGGIPLYKYSVFGNAAISVPFLSSTSSMSDPVDLLKNITSTVLSSPANPVGSVVDYIDKWRTPSLSVSGQGGGGKLRTEGVNRIILEHFPNDAGVYQQYFGKPDNLARKLSTLTRYVRTKNCNLYNKGLPRWIIDETKTALDGEGVFIEK